MTLVATLDTSFDLLDGETLLEGLERTGHEVEYQCRSGYCGSCRTRLISGEVRYLSEPLAFMSPNEVLPCCCVPVATVQLDVSRAYEPEQLALSEDLEPQNSLDFNKS
ncbi:MAG: class I ribonucleotide reductase maintenance protein YfaE [Advenella sp.]|nr:class I ribonucleotide reductase maintenance protein YfaE [Advenella sp.]